MARLAVHNSKDLPVSVPGLGYKCVLLCWGFTMGYGDNSGPQACMTHHLPGPHKF